MIKELTAKQLKLGDTVKLFDDAYGYAIVIQIHEGTIKFFRTYATCSDFSYGGNQVIPYTCHEIVTYLDTTSQLFEVIYRKEVR